ncbi:MAG: hypothetical protein NT036_02200 [Candidatus Omnitrophica bacterium]|nr:hypothetical protein [Candidatus Omnitrophota bacterium]
MKIIAILRTIPALLLPGLPLQMAFITTGYRFRYPVSSYIYYDRNGVFGALEELFGRLNSLIAGLFSAFACMISSILIAFTSISLSLRVDLYIVVSFIAQLVSSMSLRGPSEVRTEAISNNKTTATKINKHEQNIYTKVNFENNVPLNKNYELLKDHKNILKSESSKVLKFNNQD